MFASSGSVSAIILAAALGMIGAVYSPVQAQQNPNAPHEDNGGLNGSLSRGDLDKLGGDHKPDTSADLPKDPVLARAKAKAQSIPLLESLQIACDVSDAKLVVAGTRKPASGGQTVATRVYEVACSGGMGYLLETQGAEKPIPMTCLAAEEARAIDAAKGKEPAFFCQLPDNKDVYAMLTSMISAGSGGQCTVGTVKLFGHSESTHSDYSEVACKEGNGFLLRIAQPGTQAKTVVMSCNEAAKQGIKCKLTDPGPAEVPVTMQTFKEALARNGVTCNIGQIRLVGQEDHLKRYVVEYLCADRVAAMVALIPLQGNTNPYESLDCATALADRGVVCSLAAH